MRKISDDNRKFRKVGTLSFTPQDIFREWNFVEDLSLNKVSEIMNMPSGTVKSHLSRARQRLNVYLDKEDYKYGE